MGEEYSIEVAYNNLKPEWKKATKETFKKLIDKGLSFSAHPRSGGHDLNAVRVHVTHKNVCSSYSPIDPSDSHNLDLALEKLVEEEKVFS